MLCCLPFWKGDVEDMARLLTWIRDLTGAGTHKALLVADASVAWADAARIVKLSEQAFAKTHLIVREPSVIGWPYGPNALFETAADHCKEPWLWMETDAVPLHRDWLNLLESEYQAIPSHAAFLGCIYPGGNPDVPDRMMSGIAVYPANAGQWLRDAQLRPGEAFDVGLSRFLTNEKGTSWGRVQHTNRIHQHLGPNRANTPTFKDKRTANDQPRVFTLASLKPNAVLFHRNKDGTLIELLRQKMGMVIPVVAPRAKVIIRRTGAIGDVLAATIVAKKMWNLGYDVTFQAHSSCHCVLKRVPWVDKVEECVGQPHADLDMAYEKRGDRKHVHFAQMFVDAANQSLHNCIANAKNSAPRMTYTDKDRTWAEHTFSNFPKPWTIIVPRSNSWVTRTVPDRIWAEAAAKIVGTKFWLALHPAPVGAPIVDLGCRHFDDAIRFLGGADLVVSVDTGPMHVAAALGVPVVAIQQQHSPELSLTDQQDFVMISPMLSCLNCNLETCPHNAATPPCQNVSPQLISDACNKKLHIATTNGISAVISIYKPRVENLNRCLKYLLGQVQEIVVVSDTAGFVPTGALTDPKIHYVKMKQHDVGYGRKANFGARHTNSPFIWFINDDCFANPNCGEHLLAVLQSDPKIGMVGHLLRWPNGKIQHGGTFRATDGIGFGHMDLHQDKSRFSAPLEVENVTGASIMVRRKAYYAAGGHDERYFLYCEDNHLCMSLREAGWKIYFTPLCEAIHLEHQSTSTTPHMNEHLKNSCRVFGEEWGFYFEKNKHVQGLGSF
jgi:GT2 family glycosyltransferase/ADP-heptose:LPS heptosyltransferase